MTHPSSFADPLTIFYFVLGGLALVIIYIMIASVFWHQDTGAAFKNKPFHRQLSRQLSDLHLPKSKMQETVNRMADTIHQEVLKETQKAKAAIAAAIEVREKQITAITQKYKTVEQNYQTLGKRKIQTESVVRSIAKE